MCRSILEIRIINQIDQVCLAYIFQNHGLVKISLIGERSEMQEFVKRKSIYRSAMRLRLLFELL